MNPSHTIPARVGGLTLTVPSGVYFADSDPDTNWYFHDLAHMNAAFRVLTVAVRAPVPVPAGTLAVDCLATRFDLFPLWACTSLTDVSAFAITFPAGAARTTRFGIYGYEGEPLEVCAVLEWRLPIPEVTWRNP